MYYSTTGVVLQDLTTSGGQQVRLTHEELERFLRALPRETLEQALTEQPPPQADRQTPPTPYSVGYYPEHYPIEESTRKEQGHAMPRMWT
jgi:hypothetical protein